MVMSNAVYPYRIRYPRTGNWWGGTGTEGEWSKLASWCDQCIGKGEWEYYWEEFVFSREEDYMLFKLKWIL
jgi:hypothetical protein